MENLANQSNPELLIRFGDAVYALRTAIREKRAWDEYKEAIDRRDTIYNELMRRLSK